MVGTFKSVSNYIWAASRHLNINRYYHSGRHLYNCWYIFYSGRQVGTLKFDNISLQFGRSALLTMLIIHWYLHSLVGSVYSVWCLVLYCCFMCFSLVFSFWCSVSVFVFVCLTYSRICLCPLISLRLELRFRCHSLTSITMSFMAVGCVIFRPSP